MRYSKADVEVHSDKWLGHDAHPAVNVKARNFGGHFPAGKLADKYAIKDDDPRIEKALEFAFECSCQDFWENLVPEIVNDILVPRFGDVKFQQEGRSGGWLVITGLPDVASWDAIDTSTWERFERSILEGVDFLCSEETVLESIDMNGWID